MAQFPIGYPTPKNRKKINNTDFQSGLIVEDVAPLTNAANDLNDRVVVLENTPSGGSSPIIASGEFNLMDAGVNVLTWTTDCTAANTAPTGVVVTLTANDTYVDNSTVFDLKLNGQSVDFNSFLSYITTLVFNKIFVTTTIQGELGGFLYSNTGDWALPVTVGTLNDFRIKIQILGARID